MSIGVVVVSSSKVIWKIENFSDYKVKSYSEVFSVGSFKWKVMIYPKGDAVNDYLSLYLVPVDLTGSVYVQFSVVIGSQAESINNTVRKESKNHEFSETMYGGWPEFMSLSELHDPVKGHIVNDTCIITIEVSCKTKEDSIGRVLKESDQRMALESEANRKAPLKYGESSTQLGEYPSAGHPFGVGRHNRKAGFGDDREFEDVGGFSILKSQAPLYKQIWLKYGHIPSTKVMPISSYHILVMVVKDLMNSISDMHQCRYVDLSSEMIEGWEEKINMAEAVKFNIGWLREILDIVKKGLGGMQKVKTELLEHGLPLRAAKSRVKAAGDELKKAEARLKKAEAQLIAAKDYLRENVASGLLSESDMEMYLDIGEDLLFDGLF